MRALIFSALALALTGTTTPADAQALNDALQNYAAFESDVSALMDAEITSPAIMNDALDRAARHDSRALVSGWIAYGAVTAAQSPAFVVGVRNRVRAAGRPAVLRQLLRDTTYARRRPPGATEAVQLTLNTLTADGARLDAAAQRFQVFGDTERGNAWNASEAERDARGQHLRESAAQRQSVAPELAAHLSIAALAGAPLTDADAIGGRRFWDAATGRSSPTLPAQTLSVRDDRAAALDQMLTLAALIVVEGADSNATRVSALLEYRPVRDCLALQQLEFRQCVSVAHDATEDGLCLARHGLEAPGACLAITR